MNKMTRINSPRKKKVEKTKAETKKIEGTYVVFA